MAERTHASDLGAVVGGTIYTAFLHMLFPIGIVAFLLYGAPRFERAFMNLQTPLPEVTQFVLDCSQIVTVNLSRVITAVAILLVLDAMIYFLLRRSIGKLAGSMWSGLILLGEIGCAVFCVLSMVLPVTPLGQGLRSACLL